MNEMFTVALADGTHFTASGAENLLLSAQRAQWLVRYGCRNGNCEACVATLLQGRVLQRGEIIAAPAAQIFLCLCSALSDLQIVLPTNPQPGSIEQSQRRYALLRARTAAPDGSVLHFLLPAGRQPSSLAGQYALIETEYGELPAEIDTVLSRGRELVVHSADANALHIDAYYYLRYPLNAFAALQQNRSGPTPR
jgi:ferredoxin